MKNKATLSLIELVIMLLVFISAAALCLNAFVWADEVAQSSENRNHAMLQVQNAAEILKACEGDMERAAELFGGTWDGKEWRVFFDEKWEPAQNEGEYILVAAPLQNESELLGAAEICLFSEEACLITVNVAWQEVMPDA